MHFSSEGEGNRNRLASEPGKRSQFTKHCQSLRCKRNNVFALHFRALRRDTPNRLVPIEIFKFRPARCSQLSCAGKRQNHEPQGQAGSQITIIRAERSHKFRHLIERHCLVATRPAGGFQRASKVGRRVMLCPPGRDGIAEYLAARLPQP